jgi:ribonuclease R
MLPEALSNGVCSLRPDEERACLAVEMIISAEGQKQSHKFMRGLMRSHARLTYTQVQQVIDGQSDESDLAVPAGTLHHLIGAYRCLSSARAARGTLNLDVPERRIVFSEDGRAEAAVLRRQQEANQLIEEFMIAANICAAEQIETKRGICVYRVHDQPDPEKIEGLRELTDALELPFAPGQVVTPTRFNELLNRVKDTPAHSAVNEAVLRCQSRAVYDIENLGHYGLGLVKYGHFTSPIRRYADLMVHRALITGEALGAERPHSDSADVLAETCAAISQTEQNAARAERRTITRLAASLVSHRLNSLIDVTILGVTRAGLFVLLDDKVTEGFVPRRTLPDDYYEIVSGGMMLNGKRSGWQFSVGDTLSCLLTEISPASGDVTLNFRNGGTQTVANNKPRNGHRKRPTHGRKPAPKPFGTSRRARKRRPG